jgi:hypothetical protein
MFSKSSQTLTTVLVLILGLGLVNLIGVRDAFGFSETDSGSLTLQTGSGDVKTAHRSAYDSGWESLGVRPDPINIDFNHNLGGDPDDYRVSLECRDDTSLGTYDCTDMGFNMAALWFGLNDTMVSVEAESGSQPDNVRVRIYSITPAYDSGWESLGVRPDPISVEFVHNLGGNPNDYQVDLECRDDTSLGTYDCTNMGFNVNALWYALTDTSVKVSVVGGSQPDDVRVRIYRGAPDFDSGWESLGVRPDPINVDFNHNLGGNPDDYRVSLECRDDTSLGTYDCTDMGFNMAALWFGLTDTMVSVEAGSGSQPDDVRVRIWSDKYIYLPLVFRD